MMSLSKMAPLSWAYYAEEIAVGREDYYATAAERPGRFPGHGAGALGIAGEEVSTEGLERLFGQGCDPRDGRALGRAVSPVDERAVAGFPLTFSPLKTVSVLWALGDEEASAAVLDAHEAAVGAAMAFLEDHAAFTRRGHGGPVAGRHRRAPRGRLRAPDVSVRGSTAPYPRARREQGAHPGREMAVARRPGAVRPPEGRRHALQGGPSLRAHGALWGVPWSG